MKTKSTGSTSLLSHTSRVGSAGDGVLNLFVQPLADSGPPWLLTERPQREWAGEAAVQLGEGEKH